MILFVLKISSGGERPTLKSSHRKDAKVAKEGMKKLMLKIFNLPIQITFATFAP